MRLAVDGLEGLGVGEPEIGRGVDDRELGAGSRGPVEHLPDERGRLAVRRGREQDAVRLRLDQRLGLALAREARVAERGFKMRKARGDRLAGLAR